VKSLGSAGVRKRIASTFSISGFENVGYDSNRGVAVYDVSK